MFLAATADLAVAIPREHAIAIRAPQPRPAVAGSTSPAPARIGRPLPSRRRFLRVAMALTAGTMGGSFVSAGVAYLWPRMGAGFGSLVDIGPVDDVSSGVDSGGGTYPVPAARAYLVAYDPRDDPEGDYAELTGGTGMMALYQKCVHLGCRVPWCGASSWFECPCRGSQYNRWGEYQAGPAPRGLDRFNLRLEDGRLVVDTRTVITGPSRGVDTLKEPPRGLHCGTPTEA